MSATYVEKRRVIPQDEELAALNLPPAMGAKDVPPPVELLPAGGPGRGRATRAPEEEGDTARNTQYKNRKSKSGEGIFVCNTEEGWEKGTLFRLTYLPLQLMYPLILHMSTAEFKYEIKKAGQPINSGKKASGNKASLKKSSGNPASPEPARYYMFHWKYPGGEGIEDPSTEAYGSRPWQNSPLLSKTAVAMLSAFFRR